MNHQKVYLRNIDTHRKINFDYLWNKFCKHGIAMFKRILFMLILAVMAQGILAQTSRQTQQRLDGLLEQKARCLEQNRTKFFYYIQIYNGKDVNRARQLLRVYLARHPESKAFIKWENPEYKVWTGEYMSILDVEKAMQLLRDEYPNALIVYPRVH